MKHKSRDALNQQAILDCFWFWDGDEDFQLKGKSIRYIRTFQEKIVFRSIEPLAQLVACALFGFIQCDFKWNNFEAITDQVCNYAIIELSIEQVE